MPGEPIPRFFLYGEPPRAADERFVHLEMLDERSRPANWTIRPHAHADLHHLFHMESGGGVAEADGQRIPFTAPCVVVVPAGVVHGFRYVAETQGRVLTFADGLLRELARREQRLRELMRAGLWVAALHGEVFAQRLPQLARELGWAGIGHELAVSSLLGQLLVETLRLHHDESQQSMAPPGPHATLVARYRELIEGDFRQHPSVEASAANLGVSARQLRNACETVCGLSPLQMRQQRLLLEARRLMSYSNMRIAQVSAYLGFDDPAYFTRFFAQANGTAPRRYRQRISRRTRSA